VTNKKLFLGGLRKVHFDMDKDMLWRWDQVLKTHPNGMRFTCFNEEGGLLAANEYFSVGGGFVVNEKTKVDENLFYKGIDKSVVHGARLHQSHSVAGPAPNAHPSEDRCPTPTSACEQHPPFPFESGKTLLALTAKHNLTIAQIVYENEKFFGLTENEIYDKLIRIWDVMDECIRTGVSTSEETLPGRLGLRRRAPNLYRRLMRGFYPGMVSPTYVALGPGSTPHKSIGEFVQPHMEREHPSSKVSVLCDKNRAPKSPATRVVGSFDHPILPTPPRRMDIPAVDFLSCYATAVNEVNAAGGRIVTSPTNGAAGIIPAVLKYVVEFVSDEPEKSVQTFLLTAAAIGMLFKRGSTISAAEGGCQAEVGVACSMASAGFAACMGATPEIILQAAEIGIA